MTRLFHCALSVTTLITLVASSAAPASIITYEASLPLTTTNIKDRALSLPQFDPGLGKLDWVTVEVSGTMYAGAGIENQKKGPSTIYWKYTNDLALSVADPTGVDVLDMAYTTHNPNPLTRSHAGYTQIDLAGFDGKVDFDGPSGRNWVDLKQTDSKALAYSADLSPFIGTGDLTYLVNANSYVQSTTSNSGWTNEFFTFAGADLKITYGYSAPPPVPEPATLALLAMGGAAILRRRRVR